MNRNHFIMNKELQRKYNQKYLHSKNGVIRRIYDGMKYRQKERQLGNLSFTLEEFKVFMESHQRFSRLYNEWVKSGYQKLKAPTCDRINPKLGYYIINIQILTWEENRYKERMEIKILNSKPVSALKDGIIIHSFRSQSEAARKLNFSQSCIGAACRGILKSYRGFKWQFALLENKGKPIRKNRMSTSKERIERKLS